MRVFLEEPGQAFKKDQVFFLAACPKVALCSLCARGDANRARFPETAIQESSEWDDSSTRNECDTVGLNGFSDWSELI